MVSHSSDFKALWLGGGGVPIMARSKVRLSIWLPVLALATVFLPAHLACADGSERAYGAEPVPLKYGRAKLTEKWRARINSFLDKGVIPLISMQATIRQSQTDEVAFALDAMDEFGFALISFDGHQAPKDGRKGYRWSYHVRELVNRFPDRIILATNGGNKRNWAKQKGGRDIDFIDQTERHVRTGVYPLMGEFEFRHYMSSWQCQKNATHRDVKVPINGPNGHRLFKLAAETGVPFVIHHDPEDKLVEQAEQMLARYPKAKVIWAHFTQIRNPARQRRFGPKLVRRLLETYSNLSYDLAIGRPERIYKCTGQRDTMIWDEAYLGIQSDDLKPEYKKILTEYSTRFVSAIDFGGGRPILSDFLENKAANLRLILKNLPVKAQHDIAYRNAWKLLTGKGWR
jgi:hypothetical protein